MPTERPAKFVLRMSEVESVKKRWLTVNSTVFYELPRALTFPSLKSMRSFFSLALVLVV
jgi:hypothetical protein